MQKYVLSNGDTLVVRHAQPNDAERIVAYLNTVSYETDQVSFSGYPFPMSVAQERVYLENIVAGNSRDAVITGWIGDYLVSVAHISAQSMPRRHHMAEVGISVRAAYRGAGVGSRMLSSIMNVAQESGFTLLTLWVRIDNRSAISLYHKHGFIVHGTLPGGDTDGSTYHAVYLMSAWLE